MRKIVTTVREYEYDKEKELYLEDDYTVKEVIIYNYDELSEKAQEKAREEMLNDKLKDRCFLREVFTENVSYGLRDLFPNSELKIQYSLTYCQGDGLNIYGELNLQDMYQLIKEKLDIKEQKYIEFLLDEFNNTYELKYNNRYCYCICGMQKVLENISNELDFGLYKKPKYDVMDKFENLTKEYLTNLCKQYEDEGYKYFYELSEDDIYCYTIDNEMKFYENGNMVPAEM